MRSLVKTMILLFSREQKKNILVLLVLAFFNGIFQTLSVLSVIPFIALVSNPDYINSSPFVNKVYTLLGFEQKSTFILFAGFVVLFVIIFSNLLFAFNIIKQKRFVKQAYIALSNRLLHLYITQPYQFFVHSNSSDLTKKILEDARYICEKLLISLLDITVSFFISLFILIMLLLANPVLSISVGLVISVFYIISYRLTRRKVIELSHKKVKTQKALFRLLAETFGGIKDIKVLRAEKIFLRTFRTNITDFSESVSRITVFTKVPNLFLDVITYGGLVAVVLYLLMIEKSTTEIVPILVLYALSIQRLKPHFQVIFSSITNINYLKASVDQVSTDFNNMSPGDIEYNGQENPFEKGFNDIRITRLKYRYRNSSRDVISDLDLHIQAKSTVAFVGSSGSGKTTLADILLGILDNYQGTITVDNIPISPDNIRQWQKNIGYIPQHIFLLDDSIARNIAFGIDEEKINYDKVNEVVKAAGLEQLVKEQPDGLNTNIGERGVKLSGGQRQRIGIARALYRDPQLLVMDEATSALDGITEEKVMESIYALSGSITILMIAHRLSTIKDCDVIHFMSSGAIIQSGSYDELLKTNEQFRMMAKENSPADKINI